MMNTIVNIIYGWNYIVRVNPEKNDTENTMMKISQEQVPAATNETMQLF